jgi:hypothetical protein
MTGVHGRARSSPRNAFISLAAVCCSIVLAAMSFAASGADPNKVLHVALVAPETGFDPQAASDLYSNYVDEAKRLPGGPKRVQLFRRMSTLVTAYAPWKLHAYRLENIVVHPWVLGYKYNTFESHPWMYFDIDLERRKAAGK